MASLILPEYRGSAHISTLHVGDYVLAYNEETQTTGYYPVTELISHFDETLIDLTIDGELVETTPEHPFYTSDGEWVEAEDLKVGDLIRSVDGSLGKVDSIVVITGVHQPMYNFTVDEAHTYFVGDGQWLVHNTSGCGYTVRRTGKNGNQLIRLTESGQLWNVPPGGSVADIPEFDMMGDALQAAARDVRGKYNIGYLLEGQRNRVNTWRAASEWRQANLGEANYRGTWLQKEVARYFPMLKWTPGGTQGVDAFDPVTGFRYDIMSITTYSLRKHIDRPGTYDILARWITY